MFTTPEWLRDTHLYNISSTSFASVENVQKGILLQLIDAKYINRLAMQEAELGAKSYTVLEMLTDLKKGIFSELTANKPISLNRRNLQKVYVIKLLTLLPPDKGALAQDSDASSVVKAHARALAAEIKRSLPNYQDVMSVDHLKDLADRLTTALDPKR